MKQVQEQPSENKIYLNAFIGVLLFIAALALTNLGINKAAMTYTVMAGATGITSLFLLVKAIKNDPSRLKWKE